MTDDNAVPITADTARDLLLVNDIVADPSPVKDLAVELGTVGKHSSEALAEILVAVRDDGALRILDHTVRREAGDEALEVALVVRVDVLVDGVAHGAEGP
jgi:hypothetical protein